MVPIGNDAHFKLGRHWESGGYKQRLLDADETGRGGALADPVQKQTCADPAQAASLIRSKVTLAFMGGFFLCYAFLHCCPRMGLSALTDPTGFSLASTSDFDAQVSYPVLSTALGQIRGVQDPVLGRRFYGIPYGKAGRWEVPAAVEPWMPEIVEATSVVQSCETSEDCLFLNVYTPPPESGSWTSKGRPVMVWFHGGSFVMGSANDLLPEHLRELQLTNGLVIVSVEYRLGALGFLASRRLQPQVASTAEEGHLVQQGMGNFGILDQQIALEWVRDHVSVFGGDPAKVGIVGWSAGAASVGVHLTMPSSFGLFSRAVMLSGGFSGWSAQNESAAEQGYDDFLKRTGCFDDVQCHVPGPPCECLLALSTDRIVQAEDGWFAAPTVDGFWLPTHPHEAARLGLVNAEVPILIGSALEDSMNDIGSDADTSRLREFLRGFVGTENLAEAFKLYSENGEYRSRLWEMDEVSRSKWSSSYWAARRVYADRVITCVARRVARRWASMGRATAYWYLWAVSEPEEADMQLVPQRAKRAQHGSVGSCWPCPGAGHGTDQNYLFQKAAKKVDNRAAALTTVYPALISAFLANKDPNQWHGFSLHGSGGVAWPTVEHGGMWFQVDQARMEPELLKDKCDFWDHIDDGWSADAK